MQANTTDKRNLVEFKNGLLEYDQELIEQCLVFMPKMLQHESNPSTTGASAIPGQKEVKNYMYTVHYSFETVENSKRADKMWETGNISKEPVSYYRKTCNTNNLA